MFPDSLAFFLKNKAFAGVTPANRTKERSVHELFPGAFRNKSSRCEYRACFPKENTQEFTKKWAKFMNFSFWPFLWFGLPGRLLIDLQNSHPQRRLCSRAKESTQTFLYKVLRQPFGSWASAPKIMDIHTKKCVFLWPRSWGETF